MKGSKRPELVYIKKAAALGYTPGDIAPQLLAKGRGLEAEAIIALARKTGVELVEDSALMGVLDSGLKPGDYIPPWCWEAVARILAFILKKENP
ncbi:MAG: EscU/YscU/HrcU family type III secretion system export apparatus switch protein [Treponema sp.]|jgi:flagellar biosynthesis protein|nr:EscU/YscU/HrcU family type III secretion system export apparatus switch protein [Treponema sp.]